MSNFLSDLFLISEFLQTKFKTIKITINNCTLLQNYFIYKF